MGTETIPNRSNGQVIDASHMNLLKSVIKGDNVPRDAAGVATTLEGALGTSTLLF